MTPERWQQIEQLFFDIEKRPAERAALAAADPELREEVEQMLAAGQTPNLLDHPAPPLEPDDPRPVPSVLGPYRIEAPLGHGGLVTVFRATDTRLHRSVAIKILAERFSDQTDIVDTGIRTGPMSFDIAPDGRFLIISDTSIDAYITVALNWRAAEAN